VHVIYPQRAGLIHGLVTDTVIFCPHSCSGVGEVTLSITTDLEERTSHEATTSLVPVSPPCALCAAQLPHSTEQTMTTSELEADASGIVSHDQMEAVENTK